jgi:gliding motility-associated-like protein
MLPDQEVQLYNLSEHGVIYLWDFGDGNNSSEYNPTYHYTREGTYDITLYVWTENGCMDTLSKGSAVEVIPTGVIVFPNVFEPDMSGPNGGYFSLAEPELNYIFRPFWEGVEKYRLEIYNRWGVLIYVSEDVMKGWDGYYQGKICPQGVYVFKCTGTFSNGKPFSHVGDVTLLYHER